MKQILTSLLFVISPLLFAQEGVKNFIDQNYIEVTGKAEMEVTPDEIYIKILLNEKDYKGKEFAGVEKTMMEKLSELGLDLSKDLVVKDLLSNFQYYWLQKADILLSKEYQLLVHDGKTAGKVFVELQKLGISNVTVDRVDNSKMTEYRRDVKITAIKAAQEKAKALAMAINQDIGRAIFVQEIDSDFGTLRGKASNIVVRGYFSNEFNEDSAPEPDIEFEKLHLEYSIIVRFELK